MNELGVHAESQAPQVREDRRRHDGQLSPARRPGDLPDARPHGAAVGDARDADRWAGEFGSVEGDPPASMRYTEARLQHLGAALMEDMDKDTVDFVPNYDETR